MNNQEKGEEQDHGEEPIQDQDEVQEQYFKCFDKFSSFITKDSDNLMNIIATEYGLLDVLVSNGGLTYEQVSLIKEKDSHVGKVRRLLQVITTKGQKGKKEAFLIALDHTDQKHVSNYIRGKGERAADYGDDWPLYFCKEYISITANYSKLTEYLDPRNGLLDEMFSTNCINYRQKRSIEEQATDEKQAIMLLQCIHRGSLDRYNAFIGCLRQTKQHHVVSLLAPSLAGDIRPLSDEQQHRLTRNYSTLIRMINLDGDLTAALLSAGCITWRQKEFIENPAIMHSDGVRRLIDVMRRGSERDFSKFIECLNETGQRHVSHLLIGDGAVAHIVATISPVNNREERERRIVDQLNKLTVQVKELGLPDNRLSELVEVARRRIEQLRENDITIMKASLGSIELVFLAQSPRGLRYLHEVYCNEILKFTMQEVFIVLLKTGVADDAALDTRIETLRWDPSYYADCLHQLDLPILSRVYEMAEHNRALVPISDSVHSLRIDEFPFELIEMILTTATGHLFVNINRTTPARAEVYTLATMMSVSHFWWEALSYRKYIRRLLRRSFQRVCHPFECCPPLVICLHTEGGMDVSGVAVYHDVLYVVRGLSNTIQVFDSRPPFSRREDIKVQGLEDARGITVCSKSSQLYIADWGQSAIWRVNLSSIEPADKFITIQWRPVNLSVYSSRLLLTPWDGESLYLYGDDGNELRHIELPRYMIATHAVETTRNTYLVSHRNAFIGDISHPHSVAEVDVNGRVIRTFNNDIKSTIGLYFNQPDYLVLANDHVLVADRYNERIVLLKSDLQLKRILINNLHGKQPRRMCFTSSRLLVVSYYDSIDIDVFKV